MLSSLINIRFVKVTFVAYNVNIISVSQQNVDPHTVWSNIAISGWKEKSKVRTKPNFQTLPPPGQCYRYIDCDKVWQLHIAAVSYGITEGVHKKLWNLQTDSFQAICLPTKYHPRTHSHILYYQLKFNINSTHYCKIFNIDFVSNVFT